MQEPPEELLRLGLSAYTAYREFQVQRLRAYRHLGMHPPDCTIPPSSTSSAGRVYHVLLDAPGCDSCHLAQAYMEHRDYVAAYPLLPILCRHEVAIIGMSFEERQRGEQVTMPLHIRRAPVPNPSISSVGSNALSKLNDDLRRLRSQARTVLEYFE